MTGNMIQNKGFSISKVKLTEGEALNIFSNNHQKFCREEKKLYKYYLWAHMDYCYAYIWISASGMTYLTPT